MSLAINRHFRLKIAYFGAHLMRKAVVFLFYLSYLVQFHGDMTNLLAVCQIQTAQYIRHTNKTAFLPPTFTPPKQSNYMLVSNV